MWTWTTPTVSPLTFQEVEGSVTVGDSARFVAAGRSNGDGNDDLVVAHAVEDTAGRIAVLLSDGAGGATPSAEAALARVPVCLAVAPIQGDDTIDTALGLRGDDACLVPGDGGGGLALERRVPLGRRRGSVDPARRDRVRRRARRIDLHSPRGWTDEAAEAGVETLEAFRHQGLALAAVACWARAVQQTGRLALYSTSWDNEASLAVARRLSARIYGEDWHVR